MFQVGHWYVTIWPVPSSECWLLCHWRRGCGFVAILRFSEPLTGVIKSSQSIADGIPSSLTSQPEIWFWQRRSLHPPSRHRLTRCESLNPSSLFCQSMYHLWYDTHWIEGCVLSWEWTVVYFDNRLLTYERALTLELRMPNLPGLIYVAEIIVGPVLYPERYKAFVWMKQECWPGLIEEM